MRGAAHAEVYGPTVRRRLRAQLSRRGACQREGWEVLLEREALAEVGRYSAASICELASRVMAQASPMPPVEPKSAVSCLWQEPIAKR